MKTMKMEVVQDIHFRFFQESFRNGPHISRELGSSAILSGETMLTVRRLLRVVLDDHIIDKVSCE